MTADRRIRMLPMPAQRQDRPPLEIPPGIAETTDPGRASFIANIVIGGVLLVVVGFMFAYGIGMLAP